MKKVSKILFLVFILSLYLLITAAGAMAKEDISEFPSCGYCGMDRAKFAHSRVYMPYKDGATAGHCSLHCAAIEMIVKLDKEARALEKRKA